MANQSASLARSITWKGSKQTYLTAKLLVDKDLQADFFRAYAYFRWIDDIIDTGSLSTDGRIEFIKRQGSLIERLYNFEEPGILNVQEKILFDLIRNDRGLNSGLRSFILNMFAIIEFDAFRQGRTITRNELEWYVNKLSISVTDGLMYFIGNRQSYTDTIDRYKAAAGAHIAHLLRDMVSDTENGYMNIPNEDLYELGLNPQDFDNPKYQNWVKDRVSLARECIEDGKIYLNNIQLLRCKIAGYWYCARFEHILNTIVRDGYSLRLKYNGNGSVINWLRMGKIGITLALFHFIQIGWMQLGEVVKKLIKKLEINSGQPGKL